MSHMSRTVRRDNFWLTFDRAFGLKWGHFALPLLCWLVMPSLLRGQTYLQNVGVPSFTTKVPVENGFVNVANGNLHIEIPVGSYSQKGGGVDKISLVYDSLIWFYNPGPYAVWSPKNISSTTPPLNGNTEGGGWRLVTSGDSGGVTAGQYLYGTCQPVNDYRYVQYSPWIWLAPDGTQHSFPATTVMPLYPTQCPGGGTPSATAYASDGSGFYISITNYNTAVVYAPDGTTINLSGLTQKIDPNGNKYTITLANPLNDNLVDTLGRAVVNITQSTDGSQIYYKVPNAQGGTSQYTVKLGTISYSTSFGQQNVTEASGSFQAITAITLPNGASYTFNYDSGTTSGNYGLMKSMTLATGGTINYSFTNFKDALGNVGRWLNKRTTPDSSTGWSYAPGPMSSCSSGQVNCQQKVTVTAPSGDNQVYTFTLNGGAWETAVQYNDVSQGQLATTSACYNFVTTSNGTCSYALVMQSPATNVFRIAEQTTLDGSSGSTTKTTEYSWDTSNHGNLTQVSEWRFGNAPSNSPDRTTTIAYYSNGHVINHPSVVTVSGATGWGTNGQAGQTTYGYDENNGSPQCACGNLTSITRWYNGGSSNPKAQYVYNSYGNITSTSDPNGNQTTYAYDSTNAYLNKITYPNTAGIAHNEFPSFDANTGLLMSYTDQNGNITSYGYDSMARPTSITFPATDSHGNTGGGSATFQYSDTVPNPSVTLTRTINSSMNLVAVRILDGLGRPLHAHVTSDPAGTDYADATYDNLGRLYSVSNPYRSTSDPTYGITTYKYDGLSRITSIGQPDGSAITKQYNIYCFTEWDEAAIPHGQCYDGLGKGLGRLTQLWEDQPGFNYPTYYTYDANNDLTSVNQSGLGRSYAYDSLSRMTSAADPESGTTNYTSYDSNGNLLTKTDARGIIATMTYDTLNRPLSRTYNPNTTPSVTFGYDNPNAWGRTLYNTVGQLVTAGNSNSSGQGNGSVFSYDPMGRVVRDEQCIYVGIGGCGVATAVYNYDGSQSSFTNVQGTTFSYSYNAAQQLTGVTSSLSGTGYPGTLISGFQYNALSEPTVDVLGSNAMNDSVAYTKRGWAYSYSTCQGTSSGCNAAQLDYTFNMQPSGGGLGYSPNGNITYAGDWVNGNWTYTYDGVNRLSTASCAATTCPGNQSSLAYSFSYDAWGNRKTQTVTSGTGTSWSGSYSSNKITNSGFLYDAAGNLLNDGLNSYTYDGENRITSMNNGAATYTYDPLGRRVSKVSSAGTVDYFYDVSGRQSVVLTGAGALVRAEIYSAGRHLGTYANGTTYFTLNDWLGTERVRTDVNGNVVEKCQNAPFGDFQSCSGTDPSALHFTGQESDTESGLDNFVARYYGPREGSFMSPDPLGGNMTDPQTINRYAYVRDNPVKFIDPSGMQLGDQGGVCDDDPEACLGIGIGFGGGGGGSDRQPPAYIPPNAGSDTNPSAGDPDPNGPFSGPVWQEGGPQIAPNLASLILPVDPGCEFGACIGPGFTSGSPGGPYWNIALACLNTIDPVSCMIRFGPSPQSKTPLGVQLVNKQYAAYGVCVAAAGARFASDAEQAGDAADYVDGLHPSTPLEQPDPYETPDPPRALDGGGWAALLVGMFATNKYNNAIDACGGQYPLAGLHK